MPRSWPCSALRRGCPACGRGWTVGVEFRRSAAAEAARPAHDGGCPDRSGRKANSLAAPTSLGGGTSVTLHVFVPDVDGLAERARAAAAEILQPPTDMFHGDRTVILKDPSGHMWVFLTHAEDVSDEDLRRRLAAAGQPLTALDPPRRLPDAGRRCSLVAFVPSPVVMPSGAGRCCPGRDVRAAGER
ncbi:VOC family protein [Streptomyces sp. NPDC001591]|uniref:VOC family protein n=1 Tax=Streptomyces sp. NPDC001591 TaxID=3364589 RepID=UPI003677FA70